MPGSAEGLALLERIAESLDKRRTVASTSGSGLDRARSMAEIVRAAGPRIGPKPRRDG